MPTKCKYINVKWVAIPLQTWHTIAESICWNSFERRSSSAFSCQNRLFLKILSSMITEPDVECEIRWGLGAACLTRKRCTENQEKCFSHVMNVIWFRRNWHHSVLCFRTAWLLPLAHQERDSSRPLATKVLQSESTSYCKSARLVSKAHPQLWT